MLISVLDRILTRKVWIRCLIGPLLSESFITPAYYRNGQRQRKRPWEQCGSEYNFLKKSSRPKFSIFETLVSGVDQKILQTCTLVASNLRPVYVQLSLLNHRRQKSTAGKFFVENIALHEIGPMTFCSISNRFRSIRCGRLSIHQLQQYQPISRAVCNTNTFSPGGVSVLNLSLHPQSSLPGNP